MPQEASQDRTTEETNEGENPRGELDALRVREYQKNRGLFLAHSWKPSANSREVADVAIRLRQHRDTSTRPLLLKGGKVDRVRYELGSKFSEEPFVKRDPGGGFALGVSAYSGLGTVVDESHMKVVREDVSEAGKKLRNALSAMRPEMLAASGREMRLEYADLEHRLRAELAYTEGAYHEARRLPCQVPRPRRLARNFLARSSLLAERNPSRNLLRR